MFKKKNQFRSLVAVALACVTPGFAQSNSATTFTAGNLVLSRSVYSAPASAITVGQQLPPVCGTSATCNAKATNDGTYPYVFNNDVADGNFGITSPIFLDQLTTNGTLLSTFAVPTSVLVTSFSSKSEIALNLSTDRKSITFMGYVAPVNTLDVSNSNTPGVIDPTNQVGTAFYRAVGQVDAYGNLTVTDTNAYSGNNGRAAFLSNGFYYTVGNSNNGSGTPANVVGAAGAQLVTPGTTQLVPTEAGSFSIAQYGYAADKAGKDNNFRGLTIFNNTEYVTKGSGSNGINTVYQVGNAGTLATPSNIPVPITILPGFPTTLAKAAGAANPFGLFFANANTLYVADEGDGTTANAATSTNAGLQKWILNNGTWSRAYVMQNGLNLGQQYSVANYPAALNPATDGLRNITGQVNPNGTVTIWAVTSTISANGDQGADPNKLVSITDVLANTDPTVAAAETFTDVRDAQYGEVLRGVTFTPGTVAPAPVTFNGIDSTTKGSWTGKYGSGGYIIPGGKSSPLSYTTFSETGGFPYTWANDTLDPRALQSSPGSSMGIASAFSDYYKTGFSFNVNLNDGKSHSVSLYLLDWDTTQRAETVTISDASTGVVYNTETFSNFNGGIWATWTMKGNLTITVTPTAGPAAVVSGVFFN
jgi:hypothetical protein